MPTLDEVINDMHGFRMISNWVGQDDETGFKRIAV